MSGVESVTNAAYRVYGYRWVVLAVFMLATLAIQMLWISYAPITTSAANGPRRSIAGDLYPTGGGGPAG